MASEECTIPTTSVVFAPAVSHSHKADHKQLDSGKSSPFSPSKETDSS